MFGERGRSRWWLVVCRKPRRIRDLTGGRLGLTLARARSLAVPTRGRSGWRGSWLLLGDRHATGQRPTTIEPRDLSRSMICSARLPDAINCRARASSASLRSVQSGFLALRLSDRMRPIAQLVVARRPRPCRSPSATSPRRARLADGSVGQRDQSAEQWRMRQASGCRSSLRPAVAVPELLLREPARVSAPLRLAHARCIVRRSHGRALLFRRAVCLTERCRALAHALRGEFLKAAHDLFRDHHAPHPVGEIIAKL